MDDLINQLELLTHELVGRLNEANDEDLTHFIEQREIIIQQILKAAAPTKIQGVYRARLECILKFDAVLGARMTELRDLATIELNKVSRARLQKTGYEPDFHYDGVLFDKKK